MKKQFVESKEVMETQKLTMRELFKQIEVSVESNYIEDSMHYLQLYIQFDNNDYVIHEGYK